MASNTAERVIKSGMKAYLRTAGWISGPDRSIGGMWNRLLDETKREMAESRSGFDASIQPNIEPAAAPSTASDAASARTARAVKSATEPRAISEKPAGKLESVEHAPLHVSSLEADDAATTSTLAATKSSSGATQNPSASIPAASRSVGGETDKEAQAEASDAGAALSGAGDVAIASPTTTEPSGTPRATPAKGTT